MVNESSNYFDLVLAMFNQYLFQECKSNIDDIIYAYQVTPSTSDNAFVEQLLSAIKNYSLDSIGYPLFQSIFSRTGKTQAESTEILNKIVEYKKYTKDQIAPFRTLIRDIVAHSYIIRANNLYGDSPSEFIGYLKNTTFKSSEDDYFVTTKFKDLDINTIIAERADGGIPSAFNWINQTFRPECCYPTSGLMCVTMPPGCMSGDTEVFLADGTVDTLENLYKRKVEGITVYSCDGETSKVSVAENCQISEYVSEWYVVEVDGKREYRVTENHPLLLMGGEWKRADKLKIGDTLVSFNIKSADKTTHAITNIYLEKLDTPQPVYDLVNVALYHNYAVKFDDESGFFSHNTGKTLFCMQECLNMCLMGKKCHYLCMGDMTEEDFIIRMSAQYLGIPFYEVKRNILQCYNELAKAIGDNLSISCIPASAMTVDDYIEEMKNKPYDVLFIDYDSQFKSNVATESMYLTYGDIYAKLSELTVSYKKLVFILAQPMKAAWSLPVIEMDQVGESARKIHAVDWCLTRARLPENLNGLGTSKIVKSRRGEEQVVDYNIRLSNGRFKSVPKSVFEKLAEIKDKQEFKEAEIDHFIESYYKINKEIQSDIKKKTAPGSGSGKDTLPWGN